MNSPSNVQSGQPFQQLCAVQTLRLFTAIHSQDAADDLDHLVDWVRAPTVDHGGHTGRRTGPETQVMVGIFQCTGQVCPEPQVHGPAKTRSRRVSVCCSVPQNQVQQQAAC